MKKNKLLKRPNSGNNIDNKRNSKDIIIKNLEKKINLQEEKISELRDYKTLCENKLKEFDPSIELPLKKEIYTSSQVNLSDLSLSKSNKNNRHKNMTLNRINSDLSLNKGNTPEKDKYDKLYHKYIDLLKDFKNLSNNTISTAEYSKVKSQYEEIKNKNSLLLKKLNNKEDENDTIKELNQQVETFREELVLSQALINTLRTELEHNNKKNNKNNINIQKREEAENIKNTLKNNNLLLSSILEENNQLRQKVLNNNNANYDFNHYENNQNAILFHNLKNNLNEYESKFDYFNDYINNIKNKISLIFNDLKSIIINYGNNLNFIGGIKSEINNLNNIDRFNLDSSDDEKCLQLYIDLVKYLLKDLENKNEFKVINKTDISFNKTMKQIMEIIDILKQYINGDGFIRLLYDALNIIINLSNLYKSKKEDIQNNNNNFKEKIIKMENDFEYIKQIIKNYKPGNIGKKLTYTLSYNGKRINTINKNNYYFKYS